MTAIEIIMSCVGLIICAFIFTLVCIVIMGIVWWVFKTDKDIEIETEKWEEEASGWVKVSDRLPEEREQVLIWYWNGQIHTGARFGNKWHSNFNDYDIDLATHWKLIEFKEEEV